MFHSFFLGNDLYLIKRRELNFNHLESAKDAVEVLYYDSPAIWTVFQIESFGVRELLSLLLH